MLKRIDIKMKILIFSFLLSNIMFVFGTSLFSFQSPINEFVSMFGKYCFLGTIPAFLVTIILGFLLKGEKFFSFAWKTMIFTYILAVIFVVPILWLFT